ncbi:23S rRNA (uracil(1939)-C(5))-methyltransferase RlmD [Polluticaenibacter yanchengensis]|uniref:23S rRNA (Uracil(1939)-C(5))-methyltransferase RlmD n=1 Tax=Polluticaenibacter yanchengensis TaxID=3014562 RepID=A0ABT4UPC2_9BACT|nr:23S rRNA (uracil(1939)-C(5))-methyltransferase RlmD [Chitinophagaceae bacterium LY-5]
MARKKKPNILEEVLVENYAAEGKSLSRVDGKAVFVSGAVPGDVVDVRLSKNKKDWAEGLASHFHKYADYRVKPFCEHFGVCGGCQWQMVPYYKQLEFKQKQVQDQITRIGGVKVPELEPIVGADEDYTTHYRNKLEFTFANKRYLTNEELGNPDISPDTPSAGYHAKGVFNKVVNINTCHLMAEPANLIRESVKRNALALGMDFYDIKAHEGWMRNVIIRLCTTGEIMVNVVINYDAPKQRKALLDNLLKDVPAITSLYYTVNAKWNDSILDRDPVLYFGNPYAVEKLERFEYIIGPKSFFQTNTRQGEKLYQLTRDMAQLTGEEVVYDLYCGTGSIGIFVSDHAKKIIGVEVVEAAIDDAKINAAKNNINHAEFFAGDVIDICDDAFFVQHGRPDVIITDPPRAGMHEKLVNKLLEIEAPVIVYVSCNPATQARDLKLLDAKYAIERVRPVDMFPQTHHIENVVRLVLKK